MSLNWFIAGIMQGSYRCDSIHCQNYREQLRQWILAAYPEHSVFDPFAQHQDSVDYDDLKGREVFATHNRMAGECDVLIAYVPEASMGTAIEMWEAFKNGATVIAITEMVESWSIKFNSHLVLENLEMTRLAFQNGMIEETLGQRTK